MHMAKHHPDYEKLKAGVEDLAQIEREIKRARKAEADKPLPRGLAVALFVIGGLIAAAVWML